MNILALIPARGGSKGIKRKNLITINGKSLVEHSIHHAINSELINRVIVSTDDDEIAEISINAGAEVPFLRPKHLAEDHVLDLPVFQHALNYLKQEENYVPDYVVHLRPTSPYRKKGWIDSAIDLLKSNINADSVRSVSEVQQHPYRVFDIGRDGFLEPIMSHREKEPFLLRRQDLPKMFFYNCVIDVTKPSTIELLESMTGKKILPFEISSDDVFDIDSNRDYQIAKSLLEKR